jgi:hypothetical protein
VTNLKPEKVLSIRDIPIAEATYGRFAGKRGTSILGYFLLGVDSPSIRENAVPTDSKTAQGVIYRFVVDAAARPQESEQTAQ